MRFINIIIILCISLLIVSCVTDDCGDDRPYYNYMGIMDADGTNIHYISNENMENYMNGEAQFTPDGTKLTNGRYIMNLDGTGFKQLVPDSLTLEAYCFSISSDTLFFIGLKKYNRLSAYLCKVGIDNNDFIVLTDTLQYGTGESELTISNDGKFLSIPSYTNIRIYNLESNRIHIVSQQDEAVYSLFYNNDTELIYPTIDGIKKINILSQNIQLVAPRGQLGNHNQALTKFVYKVDNNCELLELNNGTYSYSFINTNQVGEPSITNAGDKVVYPGKGGLLINYLDGTGDHVLASKIIANPKISPTGNKIIFYERLQIGHVNIGKNKEIQ